MEQQQFLLDELDRKIEMFQDASQKHKTMHRRLRYGGFSLTALLSVLSGLALYYPVYSANLNIMILVVSAVAGVLASLEGLRKADELWIHERTIFYTLSDLKREMEFELKAGDMAPATLENFFIRLQTILVNSGDKWSSGIVSNTSAGND